MGESGRGGRGRWGVGGGERGLGGNGGGDGGADSNRSISISFGRADGDGRSISRLTSQRSVHAGPSFVDMQWTRPRCRRENMAVTRDG